MDADENGNFTSGDPATSWWKDRRLYNPATLPTRISQIPKPCFLSDRVISQIATLLKEVTGEDRYKYWPGDFANGGEINASKKPAETGATQQ